LPTGPLHAGAGQKYCDPALRITADEDTVDHVRSVRFGTSIFRDSSCPT
jgi:hypothetical protein